MKMKSALFCGIAAVSMVASNADAATIKLIDQGGVAGSPAEQGFKIAAAYWESVLTNNVTINLGVKFAALDPGIIGSTGSTRSDTTVAAWKNGVLNTRSNSTLDQTAVLPTLNGQGGASFITNGAAADGNNDTGVQVYVNGTSQSSQVLYLNTSVQKAVGIYTGSSTALDGNVTFSTNFNFDFNPNDGIDAGKMDFIGVAIHEIGHALGFVSGVDFLDVYGYPNGAGRGTLGYDLNDTSIFSALDMFRFSADPNNIAPGAGPARDLTVGTASYFSIDGGLTQLFGNSLMSTGRYNGDGRQASHFKDTPSPQGCDGYNQLGILDPTFCLGEMGVVKALDLAAYDAMGWNLNFDVLANAGYTRNTAQIYVQALGVPEPASWALMIGGFGLMGAAMRRRVRSQRVTFA